MPIIRSSQLPASAQAFSMQDVEKVAKSVLLKAKLQAGQLIASAIEEAERLKEEARQEGSREGFEHGHSQGVLHGTEAGRQQALQQHSADLASLVSSLTESLSQIDAHRTAIESDGTTQVVKLAVAIAGRVIKRQPAIDPSVLEANLGEAMKLAVGAADIRIAVNPAERATLEEALPRLKLVWPSFKHVELLADDDVGPGGCRIITRHGTIDADLNTQLDRVVAELLPSGRGVGVDGWMGGAVADRSSIDPAQVAADDRSATAPPIHPTTPIPLPPAPTPPPGGDK